MHILYYIDYNYTIRGKGIAHNILYCDCEYNVLVCGIFICDIVPPSICIRTMLINRNIKFFEKQNEIIIASLKPNSAASLEIVAHHCRAPPPFPCIRSTHIHEFFFWLTALVVIVVVEMAAKRHSTNGNIGHKRVVVWLIQHNFKIIY